MINLFDILNQEKKYEDLMYAWHKGCKKYLRIVFNTLRNVYCSSNYEQVLKQWEKLRYKDEVCARTFRKLGSLSFTYGKESNFLDYRFFEFNNPNEISLSLRYNDGNILSTQNSIIIPLSAMPGAFFIEADEVSMVYIDKLLTWYNKEWEDVILHIKEKL